MNSIRETIRTANLDLSSFYAVFVYGSYAYDQLRCSNDIDIICVSKSQDEFRRTSSCCGHDVSINVVGTDYIFNSKANDSGLYHTAKFLSPLTLVDGDEETARSTIENANLFFAKIVLPLVSENTGPNIDSMCKSAALYCGKCNINYEFIYYLLKWYDDGILPLLIKRTSESICTKLIACNNEYIVELREKCQNFEYLKAKFWSTYYRVHDDQTESISSYFRKFESMMINPAYNKRIDSLLSFFESEYGITKEAFPKYMHSY